MKFNASSRLNGKTRINPETGRIETWLQPAGLPGIWIEPGFCSRCDSFNECLGLMKLNDGDWEEVKSLIESVKLPVQVAEVLDIFGHWPLTTCGEAKGSEEQ
jgi:hypothetical protein